MDKALKTSDGGGGDKAGAETWEGVSKILREVEWVLGQNHRLIQQVNENQRSKIPHNLAKNVRLISEINANLKKAMGLYSHLSAILSTMVAHEAVHREES